MKTYENIKRKQHDDALTAAEEHYWRSLVGEVMDVEETRKVVSLYQKLLSKGKRDTILYAAYGMAPHYYGLRYSEWKSSSLLLKPFLNRMFYHDAKHELRLRIAMLSEKICAA